MGAWNGWFHVNGSTYGTWLCGDPRGWRTRKHRRHVEGDYKNPPAAGTFESLYQRSIKLLKREPIYLDVEQRRIAGRALAEKLGETGVDVLAISLDACHFHVLGRFADGQVRRAIGLAKKSASFALSETHLGGAVWGKRSRALPVRDRQHQLNVFSYIAKHAEKGAWVWTFKDPIPKGR